MDPDKPVGARVRVQEDGLWKPSGYETLAQLRALSVLLGDFDEVPVDFTSSAENPWAAGMVAARLGELVR